MVEFIIMCGMGMILLILAIQDLRSKKVSTLICLLTIALIFIALLIYKDSMVSSLLGMGFGFIILGVSRITGGKIGLGDGMILTFTGLGLGFWRNVEMFAMALFMAAIVSIVLLVLKKVNRHSSLPFVPFILLSYILVFIANKPWEML